MAQIERVMAIMRYETEEDMLEDLKNCYTVRRLRFRRKKNSYIYPKASFELREILFIEKFNKEQEMTRAVVFDSEMPDIIELRKQFKEKFGSTELFDYFYINLRNRIAKDTMKAMIDGQKFGELIHEKVKASMEVVDGNRN